MKKSCFFIVLICLSIITSCFVGCNAKQSTDSTPDSAASADSAPATPDTAVTRTNGEPVDASWFDDAVFLGDSVTLKLSYYCDSHPEALGDAQFFCAGSLGYTNALWDLNREGSVHPYYQGKNYLSQDCAAVTGTNKVFIMLGMNDIGMYGIDGAMESARTLIGNIQANSPDAAIYIQSVTPMIQGKENKDLDNEKIRAFDEQLEQYSAENGFPYLDIYRLLADKDGYLPLEYCGDEGAQGIHFTDSACELWTEYLKENVQ